MLNCIIIDDEQFSIDAILKYIQLLPKLNIVGIYTDPQMALEQITFDTAIDILFMDIDMPSISGLDLAKALRPKAQKLIFTTSHSKYAFDAFESEGDAYLLKPYTFGKFSITINRLFPTESAIKSDFSSHDDEYFLVKSKEDDLRIVKVRYEDVIAFESSQNYIKIYLANHKVLIAYLTLKDVLAITAARPEFKQFHRAFIIRTNFIEYIEGHAIRMINNLSFSVGDSYKEVFGLYLSNKLLKTARKK